MPSIVTRKKYFERPHTAAVQTAAAGNNIQYPNRTIVLAPNIVFFFDQYVNTLLGSCNGLRSYQPTSCGCQGSVFFGMDYSTVGCRRTGGRRSQPGSFLFFTTSANIVLIFQSDFGSHRLACSAHPVRDDACRAGNAAEIFQNVEVESFRSQQCHRRSRLHSKRCLRVVKPLLTHFSSLGSFLFLDEIPAWPFFGKPFFGTRQYCIVLHHLQRNLLSPEFPGWNVVVYSIEAGKRRKLSDLKF